MAIDIEYQRNSGEAASPTAFDVSMINFVLKEQELAIKLLSQLDHSYAITNGQLVLKPTSVDRLKQNPEFQKMLESRGLEEQDIDAVLLYQLWLTLRSALNMRLQYLATERLSK